MFLRFAPFLLLGNALLGITGTAWAGTSNSLMDVSPDGAWLLVANPDNGTITVVNIASHQVAREIRVGAKPEGVSWIGNGPQAVVTVYHEDRLVFFDARSGHISAKLAVPPEPYGVV